MFGDFVGLFEPVGDRGFYLVAVDDPDLMAEFNARGLHDVAYTRIFQSPAKEEPYFEKRLLRTDKEITGIARKHDRSVRRVNSLIAELRRCFA